MSSTSTTALVFKTKKYGDSTNSERVSLNTKGMSLVTSIYKILPSDLYQGNSILVTGIV